MKIIYKLTLGFLSIVLLIMIVGYVSSNTSQKALQKPIEENTILLAVEAMDKIDRNIYNRIEGFMKYSKDLILQKTILESNQKFEESGDVITHINKEDKDWISAPKKEVTSFMQKIMNNELSNELKEMLKFYEHKYDYKLFGEIFVTNKYGANVAQTGKTTDYRQDDEEWWMMTKRNGLFVRDVEYDESADVYSTDIGIKIDDNKDGSFIGTMKIVLNIAEAINIIKEPEISRIRKDYKTMEYTLITKEGNIIYSTKNLKFLESVPDLSLELKYQEDEHTGKYIRKDDELGEILTVYARSKGYKEFNGLGWTLLVERKIAEIFAPVNNLRKNILVISLVITIFAALLGFFVSRSIVKPIIKLRAATIEIGSGNLDIRIEEKSSDEIGQLAASFNKMAKDLQQSRDELTFAEKRTSNITKSIFDSLITISPDAIIKTVNQATLKLLGYKENELIGKSLDIIVAANEKSSKKITIDDLIKKDSIVNVEKTYLTKNGRKIPVLFSSSPMHDNTGKFQGIMCVAHDISGHIQSEERIKKAYNEIKATQHASITIMEDLEKELTERRRVEKEMRLLNESLEQRVKERTEKLTKSNIELQKEINVRKLAEEELKKYKILFDNILDMAYICDTNGKVLFVSNVIETLSGHKQEELIGSAFAPLFDEDNLKKAMDVYTRTLNGESPKYELRFKDTGILCEYNNLPLRDENGSIIGVIGIARNITERKQTEDNLKKSEEKYRRLVDGLQDNFFFYSHNTEGVFTYVSPSIMNVLGYSPEDFLTHFSTYMTNNPNNKDVVKYTGLSIKGIKQSPYEVEIYHKNGSIRTLNVQEVPVLDINGKVAAVEGIAEDITERKKTEKRLRDSEERLRAIINNTTAVIYLKDIQGHYIMVNKQYERLFHITQKEIIGKTDYDIFPKKRAGKFQENDRTVLNAKVPMEFEEIAPHKDGLHTYISIKFPLSTSDNKIYGVCGISTDITERKRYEEKLKRAMKGKA